MNNNEYLEGLCNSATRILEELIRSRQNYDSKIQDNQQPKETKTMTKVEKYKQTQLPPADEICTAILYTGDNLDEIKEAFPKLIVKSDDAMTWVTSDDAIKHELGACPLNKGEYVVRITHHSLVIFAAPLPHDFEKHYTKCSEEGEKTGAAMQHKGQPIDIIAKILPGFKCMLSRNGETLVGVFDCAFEGGKTPWASLEGKITIIYEGDWVVFDCENDFVYVSKEDWAEYDDRFIKSKKKVAI